MAETPPTRQRAQRSDARRNIEAILDTSTACLQRNPDAGMGEIAAEAGLGRVTLYGHFKTRAELVDAVLTRTVTEADQTLEGLDLTGDPVLALAALTSKSWIVVNRFRGVMSAAQRELPADRIRDSHDRIMARVQALIEHGRQTGAFRSDLPTEWLVATAINLMHAAADEVTSGRLDESEAGLYLVATILSAYTPSGRIVPTLKS
jgi:AcrR family transcriptional regulator